MAFDFRCRRSVRLPSEGSSPSAASDTPPNITPPITVNAAPEAVARPLWTAPAAWRPACRGSHSEVVRVVDVLGGHVRARKRVGFVQAPPRSLWFEIEALTRLARHKGIAELIDVCYTAHKVDLIRPLYWGSLQELFDQADGRGLVTSLAKNLSLQLLDAMSFIHRQEIIHLDVTPSNILLTRDFTIKVADFGIAARVGQEGDLRTYGTLGYTAPECLLGSTRPTFQIDVWSTGCVIADHSLVFPSSPTLTTPPAQCSTFFSSLDIRAVRSSPEPGFRHLCLDYRWTGSLSTLTRRVA
ncbi:hypothetical protein CF327_g4895 [Tilletia walkeri]|nr:hypothetical protein CF327_g4895 [Tilletia walkeri]